jgi:hypothetical protein
VDGKSPDTILVTFVAPLGIALFLAYINDLPQYMIYNKFRLIADVSIIYRPIMIRSHSDCDQLQVDLQAVTTWEKDWIINYSKENSFPPQLIYYIIAN